MRREIIIGAAIALFLLTILGVILLEMDVVGTGNMGDIAYYIALIVIGMPYLLIAILAYFRLRVGLILGIIGGAITLITLIVNFPSTTAGAIRDLTSEEALTGMLALVVGIVSCLPATWKEYKANQTIKSQ